MRAYMCGVPREECRSGVKQVDKDSIPAHATPDGAFRCHADHLIRAGFTRLSPREFVNPKTGCVRVLTRPSKFGAPLRLGKRGDKEGGTMSGNRLTFKRGHGQTGGTVASY